MKEQLYSSEWLDLAARMTEMEIQIDYMDKLQNEKEQKLWKMEL